MPATKKVRRLVRNYTLPLDVVDALEKHCAVTGEPMSRFVERALCQFLEVPLPADNQGVVS